MAFGTSAGAAGTAGTVTHPQGGRRGGSLFGRANQAKGPRERRLRVLGTGWKLTVTSGMLKPVSTNMLQDEFKCLLTVTLPTNSTNKLCQ